MAINVELLNLRTAISKELRTKNDNLGFDTATEARHAILTHNDWRRRWPDHTKELARLAALYIDVVRRHQAETRSA